MLKQLILVAITASSIVPAALGESSQAVCSFSSPRMTLRSYCDVSTSGSLARFVAKNYEIVWSDGVQTKVEIRNINGIGTGFSSGGAIVDGEPADFLFSSDGKSHCFTISKNGNKICYADRHYLD